MAANYRNWMLNIKFLFLEFNFERMKQKIGCDGEFTFEFMN